MRITESQLRRIIAEETRKFKKGKRVNESFYNPLSAEEPLGDAMMSYIEEAMEVEGMSGEEACADLQRFVESWCKETLTTLQ